MSNSVVGFFFGCRAAFQAFRTAHKIESLVRDVRLHSHSNLRQITMRMFRGFLTALFLTGLAAAQGAAGGKKQEPREVPSFDVNALDKSADPCVDFYQYSCGGW